MGYNYAKEQCQSAAIDELFGNPADECFKRYYGAHVLLHALQYYIQDEDERAALQEYKEAVERRLHLLETANGGNPLSHFSHHIPPAPSAAQHQPAAAVMAYQAGHEPASPGF